jgi:hypothetical protein
VAVQECMCQDFGRIELVGEDLMFSISILDAASMLTGFGGGRR